MIILIIDNVASKLPNSMNYMMMIFILLTITTITEINNILILLLVCILKSQQYIGLPYYKPLYIKI